MLFILFQNRLQDANFPQNNNNNFFFSQVHHLHAMSRLCLCQYQPSRWDGSPLTTPMEASLNTSLSTRRSARGALTLGWTQMMGSRPPKMWRHSTAARCTSSESGLPPKCRGSGATLFRRRHKGMVSRNIVCSDLNYVLEQSVSIFPPSLTLPFFSSAPKRARNLNPNHKGCSWEAWWQLRAPGGGGGLSNCYLCYDPAGTVGSVLHPQNAAQPATHLHLPVWIGKNAPP